MNPWIGVDLDGTLAYYTGWKGIDHIGAPVPSVVALVKSWRRRGIDVRIFTARAGEPEALPAINAWSFVHLGEVLPVTNMKDFGMVWLLDDRAISIRKNLGEYAMDILPDEYLSLLHGE